LRDLLIIGAGGLGCPALWALGQSGRALSVGVVDHDVVDLSNLHRQILFSDAEVGLPKVDAARETLAVRFPNLTVEPMRTRVDHTNVDALVRGARVVLDGTDSFEAKFLINDACVAAGVPLVHGGVVRFSGQLMSVLPGHACVRCLFEAPPPPDAVPSCQEAGILGPVAGVIGARMAQEALAILDGNPALAGTLDIFDAAPAGDKPPRYGSATRDDGAAPRGDGPATPGEGSATRSAGARPPLRRRVRIRPRAGCTACANRSRPRRIEPPVPHSEGVL
jgi:molybdopterin-synthase adenylyltransferase